MAEWYARVPITMLIWGVAALGGALIFDRLFVVLARSGFNGRPFIERLIQFVRSGKTDEAIKLCTGTRTILSDIGLLILRTRSIDEADLRNVAAAATLSLVPRLRRRMPYFTVLAIVSVLLGVIGVTDAVRVASAVTGTVATSPSVGPGLRALELSLAVATVLVLAQGFLSAQSDRIVEQVDEMTARLVNALIDRPDVRLGHR